MSRTVSPAYGFALVWLIAFSTGCGQDLPKALPTAESVQKSITKSVETIKPMVQPAVVGGMDWELAGPLKTNACFAVIDAVPGRPAVLRISSYDDPARETFPSVMLWGQVPATTPAALVNQQIKVQAFAMRTADAAVLQTPPGQWIAITIIAATEKSITGKIEPNSSLIDTSNNSQVPVSGTFTATVP